MDPANKQKWGEWKPRKKDDFFIRIYCLQDTLTMMLVWIDTEVEHEQIYVPNWEITLCAIMLHLKETVVFFYNMTNKSN